MVSANLVPVARRRVLAREDRAANWSLVVVGYAALLGVLWCGSLRMLSGEASGLDRRLATLGAECANLESSVRALRERIARTQASLATARSIADHPDWSVLLNLIASLRGNDIEIERVALGPRKAEQKPGAPKPPKGVWIKLSGLGKDHQAIAQFALRLEGAGLFENVGLADARKSDIQAEGLIAFDIEARMEEQPGGTK